MGTESEVKVLGAWFSPYVHSVEWALKLKGIKYVVEEEDIFNKSSLLLKSNPVHKHIPVLIHNGKPICESVVIVEYIDETWKHNPLLPQDPYEKAVARFWVKFVEEKLTSIVKKSLFSEGEQQEKLVKQAKEALEVVEGELKGKKFFGGDTICLIDLVFGFSLWLGAIEEVASVQIFNPEKYPCIAKWMLNFLQLPFVQENIPPRDKLVDFFHKYRRIVLASTASK